MSYKLFDKRERSLLNDSVVADRYAQYIQELLGSNPDAEEFRLADDNMLSFDEFKEYHVLNVIGRANDFSDNMARDFQFTAVLEEKLISGQ
jgi:hypothetical protein